jgi:hypothetical protein
MKIFSREFNSSFAALFLALSLSGCDSSSGDDYSSERSYVAKQPYGYNTAQDEEAVEEARKAKSEFEEAASELQQSVDDLSHMPWRDQMGTIRSRLDDAEDSLATLESLRPNDPAVQEARDRIDAMRSHMDRLRFENWRDVRPDLSATSSEIESEASSVAAEDEE